MIFVAAAEVDEPAYAALTKVRRAVELALNEALKNSSFSNLNAKLRYIPIVMQEATRERYPARSKLRKKLAIYDCAPQLNYKVFVEGAFEEQLREYLRGILTSVPYLRALGASEDQVAEFSRVVEMVAHRILVEEREVRH
jgi:hypothetical protein